MTYDLEICTYTLIVKGLKPSFDYKWKVISRILKINIIIYQ
jgi:hypothetical protein